MMKETLKLLDSHLAHHARENPINKGGLEFVNLVIPMQAHISITHFARKFSEFHSCNWRGSDLSVLEYDLGQRM